MYGSRLNRFALHLFSGAFLVLAGSAIAQTAPVNPLDFVMDDSYQRFKTTVLGNGVVLGGSNVSTGSLGRTTISTASDGTLVVKTPTSVPLAPPVPVNVTSKIDKVAAAKAVGSFASKLLVPLNTASALYTLGKELGVAINSGPNGTTFQNEKTQNNCDTSGIPAQNASNTCKGNGFTSGSLIAEPKDATSCTAYYVCQPNNYRITVGTVSLTTSITLEPMTREQFEDRIAQKSGWPTSSKLADVVKQAIQAGEQVEAVPQSITGPASKQISKTTTTNAPTATSPNPTTTTKTTTANYTYEGAKVNVNTTTVTNVTNNAGDVIDNSTTTTEAPAEKDKTDPCTDNPDRVGCATLDEPYEEIKKQTKDVTYAKESISWAAGAICPPPWNFSVPGVSSGNFQMRYEPFCDVAQRMKPFIVAGAALLAMFIVMSGIKS